MNHENTHEGSGLQTERLVVPEGGFNSLREFIIAANELMRAKGELQSEIMILSAIYESGRDPEIQLERIRVMQDRVNALLPQGGEEEYSRLMNWAREQIGLSVKKIDDTQDNKE